MSHSYNLTISLSHTPISFAKQIILFLLLQFSLSLSRAEMAPVLSRSLATASLASLPSSSPFTARSPSATSFGTAFVPRHGGLRRSNGLSCAGLKWKLDRKSRRAGVRCEATVAEKETAETSGEKFEYQAEVCSFLGLC